MTYSTNAANGSGQHLRRRSSFATIRETLLNTATDEANYRSKTHRPKHRGDFAMSEDAIVIIVTVSCIIGAPMLIGLIAVIASHWRQVRTEDANAALKSQMIERGFSADEIIRVINAGGDANTDAK